MKIYLIILILCVGVALGQLHGEPDPVELIEAISIPNWLDTTNLTIINDSNLNVLLYDTLYKYEAIVIGIDTLYDSATIMIDTSKAGQTRISGWIYWKDRVVFPTYGVLTPKEGARWADKYFGSFDFDVRIKRAQVVSARMADKDGKLTIGVSPSEPLLGIRADLIATLDIFVPRYKNQAKSDENKEMIVRKGQHIVFRCEKEQGLFNVFVIVDYERV